MLKKTKTTKPKIITKMNKHKPLRLLIKTKMPNKTPTLTMEMMRMKMLEMMTTLWESAMKTLIKMNLLTKLKSTKRVRVMKKVMNE